jgi:hypothetical protein
LSLLDAISASEFMLGHSTSKDMENHSLLLPASVEVTSKVKNQQTPLRPVLLIHRCLQHQWTILVLHLQQTRVRQRTPLPHPLLPSHPPLLSLALLQKEVLPLTRPILQG